MTQTLDQQQSTPTLITQPGLTDPMSLSTVEQTQGQSSQKDGPFSRLVLRLRGGDGHHACAECCCFLCICCGLEELCCIETLDECFGMCC
ncbi:hypothetical protein CROQUDRAFT_670505 [Cronartium quercuum f. sp. fusiforme G11]|uniref:Uncharacterized protein n=1 Tax=Cronartium quercuum f. sp. fusiforme G11 TaxID=708437 RepID=A0A9P6NQ07_9BASI|nr:hypothetical protein CROQUDRAFT_670505 [Cronartium quercuum f. sp. fusiforme G11]